MSINVFSTITNLLIFMRRVSNLPACRDKPPFTWPAYKRNIQFCNSNSEYDNSIESTDYLAIYATEITASDNLTNDVWIFFLNFCQEMGKITSKGVTICRICSTQGQHGDTSCATKLCAPQVANIYTMNEEGVCKRRSWHPVWKQPRSRKNRR